MAAFEKAEKSAQVPQDSNDFSCSQDICFCETSSAMEKAKAGKAVK